jgi:glycerol kinase
MAIQEFDVLVIGGGATGGGVAIDLAWRGLDDLRRNWQVDRTWQPAMAAETRARLYRGCGSKRCSGRCTGWRSRQVSEWASK